jgi:autotransporter translocation and assembly factor TamB
MAYQRALERGLIRRFDPAWAYYAHLAQLVDLDLISSGELRVVGNTNIPAVLGRLEAMPGAEGEVFGTRYEVDRAVVTFANPATIEPVIEVLARTEVQDVQITVALNGKLDRLAMTLNSSPPMPEMDILSMLFTGQRADEAAPLQTGAVASTFLTGQLASAATRRARTMLDLQEFRVDPYFATESGQPAARVTLTKQLSPKLTATVASNLESNREEVIKTRWRVAPGVYVVASRDADGTYSLDVKWLRRY